MAMRKFLYILGGWGELAVGPMQATLQDACFHGDIANRKVPAMTSERARERRGEGSERESYGNLHDL